MHSIIDETPVPSIKTSWERSRWSSWIWYLTVQCKVGDRKFGETFPFEPYPGMPLIRWIEFESKSVAEFLLHLAEKES